MNPRRRTLPSLFSALFGGLARPFRELSGQARLAVLVSLAGLAAVLIFVIPRSGKAQGGGTSWPAQVSFEDAEGYTSGLADLSAHGWTVTGTGTAVSSLEAAGGVGSAKVGRLLAGGTGPVTASYTITEPVKQATANGALRWGFSVVRMRPCAVAELG